MAEQLVYARLGGRGIAPAEEVEVIELVVEVVKRFADFKTLIQGEFLLVCLVKRGGKSPKHIGEGKVRLTVAVITGRIKNEGITVLIIAGISTP